MAVAWENARIAREIEQLKSRLGQEKRYLQGQVPSRLHVEGIVGDSPALTNLLDQVAGGRGKRRHGSAPGGNWNRQGFDCPCDSRYQPAVRIKVL